MPGRPDSLCGSMNPNTTDFPAITTALGRRTFIGLCTAAMLAGRAEAKDAAPAGRKGWAGSGEGLHKTFGAHWYYNWMPRMAENSPEFVPMLKHEGNLQGLAAAVSQRGITALLGFNEPERVKQGNMSVERALELWPQLEKATAKEKLLLGSPATSSDKGGVEWFEAFMKGAEKRKLRIDFIATHWYRGRDVDGFEKFLDGLAQKHQCKVWLTEFNGGLKGDVKEHIRFLKGALKFLDKTDSIERYAFFNPKAGTPYSLVDAGGKPTVMGEMYRDAGV